MEKIRVLCYGDSNTWGYISGSDHLRYDSTKRWTKLLQNLLGEEYEIIEEGLNSRTLISDDPRKTKVGKNGYKYLIPCLETHNPIDIVVLMLGTNELKSVYNKTAIEIGKIFEEYFVKTIKNKMQLNKKYSKLIIVSPPIVNENSKKCKEDDVYKGATSKSEKLNSIYKEIAIRNNCYFIDNKELIVGIDGVHLTEESHKKLSELLEEKIKNINIK